MDRISPLLDDLILKILSELPSKVVVTTSLLSKRWCDIWKHVPKLEYCDLTQEPWSTSSFIQNFLLLHKAPVLETLHLRLSQNYHPTDIATWTSVAVSRGVRNLQFNLYTHSLRNIRLPGRLYTCETLVTLRLIGAFIVDVPLTICFRSLKSLSLIGVDFSSDEIVHRLLSGCPVLQYLFVIRPSNENVKTFTIMVPSVQILTVGDFQYGDQLPGDDVGFVIKAPSLKSLTVVNRLNWVSSSVNMPKLVKAKIKLPQGDSKKLLGCLTSAKHLSLCVKPPMNSYPIGVFRQLVSLELCTCSSDWFCHILRHTPKLRVLRFQLHVCFNLIQRCCNRDYLQNQWEQPSSVPQCLISGLETVKWTDYRGRESEKKVVMYLLENSEKLKTMTISALKSTNLEERYKMLQELSSMQRSSKKCRLSFT